MTIGLLLVGTTGLLRRLLGILSHRVNGVQVMVETRRHLELRRYLMSTRLHALRLAPRHIMYLGRERGGGRGEAAQYAAAAAAAWQP